jgi:hypothetical protein
MSPAFIAAMTSGLPSKPTPMTAFLPAAFSAAAALIDPHVLLHDGLESSLLSCDCIDAGINLVEEVTTVFSALARHGNSGGVIPERQGRARHIYYIRIPLAMSFMQ